MADRGHRLVRWVGDPAPFRDPTILRGFLSERFPVALVERLQLFDRHQRIAAMPGNDLVLGPNDGFSQTYRFGPRQFSVWMTEADAGRLFANEWDRWQFLDITETPDAQDRPPLTRSQWQQLLDSFAKLNERRRLRPQFR